MIDTTKQRAECDMQSKICFDALSAFKDCVKDRAEWQFQYETAAINWPALIAAHREAMDEIDERQASFDLRWKADMRAIKAWQAAHPGKERTWPDHADLCVWLMDEIERLKALVKDLADDLECEVNARYKDDAGNVHPAMQGRYERDMSNVTEAREALG